MTDPRDGGRGPEDPRPGAVTTAVPPPAPPREVEPPPEPTPESSTPEDEISLVEAEGAGVETETSPTAVAAALEPDAETTVPPDEAETVELARSDLQEAARVAAANLEQQVHPDAGDQDALFDDAELDPAAGPIDPRIRERRIAVTRAQGRRRLRILLAVIVVGSLIGIAWLIVQSPFLALDQVTIQGTLRESPEAVRVAAGVDEGSALLFVDTGDVARRIERLPWIERAKVERELPHDLRITVVERLPVAWLRRAPPSGSPRGTEGPAALVDATGRVLGDEPSPPVGLPEIEGVDPVGIPGSRIARPVTALAVALLPDALGAQVRTLARDDGEWVLHLEQAPGGVEPAADEVRLGRLEDVAAKGAAALAVLDQLVADETHVTYVDVRVPGAPATR